MRKIYELEPKKEEIVMGPEETKKCKIIPRKYSYIPDLLPNNKRIEGEITLELNKAEIARAMSLADVYLVGEDGSETLLDPQNYYISLDEKKEETTDSTPVAYSRSSESNSSTVNQNKTATPVTQQPKSVTSTASVTKNNNQKNASTVSTSNPQQAAPVTSTGNESAQQKTE